ncbi:MAG: hypothetical protein ACFCUG_07480 [Thiotrichales bacterium]
MKGRCRVLLLLALVWVRAEAEPDRFGFSLGAEYTTGDYGLTRATEVWQLPLTLSYTHGRALIKLGLSWLDVSGPAHVIDGIATTNQRRRAPTAVSGPGDVTVAASYAVHDDRATSWLVDLTGKVKLGLADAERGLGTGENDYTVQLDFNSSRGRWQRFATLGWRQMGDSPTLDYRDRWLGGLGATYTYAPRTQLGASWDYRQPVLADGAALSELTLFASLPLDPRWKLQPYLMRGFTDASSEWGAGIGVAARF